jgi:hypothetical protein
MNSIHVNFNEATQAVNPIETAAPEPWKEVCQRFENDVRRLMAVSDHEGYTALYACYDENNQPVYYLVEEDASLRRLRQKTFLSKLGHK